MSRRLALRLVAPACALAMLVAASGCSSTLDDAARVGDHHVERSQFDEELGEMLENEAFVEVLDANGFVAEEGGASASAEVTAIWLGTRIRQLVIDDEFEQRELELTQEHRDAALTLLEESFGGPEVFADFGESLRTRLVEREARRQALVEALTDPDPEEPTEAELREYYDSQTEQACPSGLEVAHVLVASDAEAQSVLDELAGGAEFGDVARRLSTDSGSASNGGDLGCFREGQFVDAFEAAVQSATPGEPAGPVQTEFGFHVVLVTEYEAPSFESVREQIAETLKQQAGDGNRRIQEVLDDALGEGDVWVAERYGTWVPTDDFETGHVEPPVAPEVRDERDQEQPEPTTG